MEIKCGICVTVRCLWSGTGVEEEEYCECERERERIEGLFATSRGLFAEESQLYHVCFVTETVQRVSSSSSFLLSILLGDA